MSFSGTSEPQNACKQINKRPLVIWDRRRTLREALNRKVGSAQHISKTSPI